MINLNLVKRLIEAVENSEIDTLELSRWGTKIRISKAPPVAGAGNASSPPPMYYAAPAPVPAPPAPVAEETAAAPPPTPAAAPASNLAEVESPMVGTFYRAPAPDADPYVQVGDRVSVGQTLCILEAMKLMNELEAEVGGTIKEICVENAEPVEYGQVLFRIAPD
jgi:acetyl-CoA carboxylase biotin carboxyl carrier protein